MLEDQTKIYETVWRGFSPERATLKSGRSAFNTLSARIQIEPEIRARIKKFVDKFEPLVKTHDYIPSDSYHLTLKSFGAIDKEISSGDIDACLRSAKKILLKQKPFDIILKGINTCGSAVFAQVFSPDGRLFDVNKSLSEVSKCKRSNLLSEDMGYIPHVDLLHFVKRPEGIFEGVGNFREAYFGRMAVRKVDMVIAGLGANGYGVKLMDYVRLE